MGRSSGRSRPCAETGLPEMSGEELEALRNWMPQNEGVQSRYLEVGTAAGGTLCFMMNCFSDAERPEFVVVDTMRYFPQQFEIVKRNLADNGLTSARIDFRVMTSSDALTFAEKNRERFDFILVDASHKIRHVMGDLRWMRLLRAGGMACLHDYTSRFKGVCLPVDRFLKRNQHFKRIGLVGSLLCIHKKTDGLCPEVSMTDRLWSYLLSPLLQLDSSVRKRLHFGKEGG